MPWTLGDEERDAWSAGLSGTPRRRSGRRPRQLKETFGARNPKIWLMRTHVQTVGVSLRGHRTEQSREIEHLFADS